MGLFDKASEEYRERHIDSGDDMAEKDSETTIAGESVQIGESETAQTGDDTVVGATSENYGVPRGRDALEARQIGQTWPMEIIKAGVIDQLTGGELAFTSDDGDVDAGEEELMELFRDVLDGPHLMGDDLDDLATAAVTDMVDIGNAYWEVLESESGALPVASLKPVDALTVRHRVDDTGAPEDPPYVQAPFRTMGGAQVSLNSGSVVKLEDDELVELAYPGSRRSYQVYPRSPAMMVRDVLKVLSDSTTHHSRFYSDNEIPPGFVQIMGASPNSVEKIKDSIQQAAGDPRSVEVVGGEGAAQWIEMGGTSVNLDVIEEQKWFLQLCLAAFGLSRQEINLIEDVNRSTADGQLEITHKRITSPFAKTLGQAITRQLLTQFDTYNALDRPFDADLKFSDPAQERAQETHLRERYQSNGMTYREYRRELGDEVDEEDTTVEIDGDEVDYGAHPLFVVKALIGEAKSPDMDPDEGDGDGEGPPGAGDGEGDEEEDDTDEDDPPPDDADE